MCGLGVGWIPNAERRGSDATGIRSGIGWFGIDGLALLAAGAGADAGAGAVLFALDAAFFDAAAAAAVLLPLEGAGDGEGLTGGLARGVFRLVALVSVGCMVGGRTATGAAAPPKGETPPGGRIDVGVGGSVDANISPE